jgi:hypothetical protein
MPSKLAQLIAHNEGFGVPGAIPTVRNNPGDLKHSPHSSHVGIGPNDIGIIDTVANGWADLERQLRIYAEEGLTLQEMVNVYLGFAKDAPLDTSIVDGNNRVPYLNTICSGLGVPPTILVSAALELG